MSDIVENLQNIKNKLREGVCGQREIWEGQLEEAIGAHADVSRRLAEAGRENEQLTTVLRMVLPYLSTQLLPNEASNTVRIELRDKVRAALTTTPSPGSAAG